MPPALRFRLIESDAPPPPPQPSLDEVPVLPPGPPRNLPLQEVPEVGVSAIEVHDPTGAETGDRSIFRRLFILSLVLHAIIVLATMWTSPFGEERSAGGTDEIIPLDGISVEIVDSLPGDGAAIPAPVSLGTLLDADSTAPTVVKVATAADTRAATEPETMLVTEESLTAAAEAITLSAEPIGAGSTKAVAEDIGAPAPNAEAQLEIDTPSFAVAASSISQARSMTIESVIEASEAAPVAAAPPAAAAVVDAAATGAVPAPTASALIRPPKDAETVATGVAAPSPAPAATYDTARDEIAAVRETTPADAAALIEANVEAATAANSAPAQSASSEATAAAAAPEVSVASGRTDIEQATAPDAVAAVPSQMTATELPPTSAATRSDNDRRALDVPRAVPAQTASASAPQTAAAVAAAVTAPDAATGQPANAAATIAVAAPPIVEAISSIPLYGATTAQPVDHTSAATAAASDAIAVEPVTGDRNLAAVAVEPNADTDAVAAVAPIDTAEDSRPDAPATAADDSAVPQSTAVVATATSDNAVQGSAVSDASTVADADPSLQSDPLNLVAAPLPRPRPTVVGGGIENKTADAESAEQAKATNKPSRKSAKPAATTATPAASSVPLIGGGLSPFSVAQPGARGPTAGTVGAGGTNRDAQGHASVSSYRTTLFAHLRQFRSYPPEARRQGIKGTATVTFTVNASGALVAATLSGGSGAAILDREAMAMVRRASPFPPIPASLRQSQVTVRAPIRFDIR